MRHLRSSMVIATAVAILSLQPALARGAQAPAAHTGAVTQIGYSTAVLNGTINTHNADTTYYFQYGASSSYGSQTSIAGAPASTTAVKVSLPIGGLAPVSTYHYRLVALNSQGASIGADRTFKTKRVPLSVGILGAPNPVSYGGLTTIQGTVSGTGNAGIAVVLQSNPFPYTQGFVNVGNAQLTNTAGGYSFLVAGLTAATQFRVLAASRSAVLSPILIENVAALVSMHVRRTHRRHHVRIYGTVRPQESGMQVGIMRVRLRRSVLVAGTILHHRTATSSSYSKVVKIVPGGLYRVLVRITDGSHTSAYSAPRRIR